jgi:4-amino-4-deoxy-L-arabinose transferase-like glycosyltransferase
MRTLLALALTAICLGALVLRLTEIGKLQPYFTESDAFVVAQMQMHRAGIDSAGELPLEYYAYPTLLARSLAWIPPAQVDPGTPPREWLAAGLKAASADFVRVRTLVAVLSALLVPATFLLARRFIADGWALLAAALVATSLLHLLFSQQARPHGAQATMALLAVIACLRLVRRPDWGSYLLASASAGLAVGTLHSGIFVLPPILVAHLLAPAERDRAPRWSVALPFLAAGAAFLCFYPRLPTLQEEGGVFEFGGHTLRFAAIDGSGLRRVVGFFLDHDPVLLVLAGLGLAMLLVQVARRGLPPAIGLRRELLVVLAYALPYSLALLVFGEVVDRMLLPMLPFLALLSAAFAAKVACVLTRRVAAPVVRTALHVAMAAAVLCLPVLNVRHFVRVSSAPDTAEQAAAWIAQHLDPATDRVALTPRLSLPLLLSPEALRWAAAKPEQQNLIWTKWQIDHLPLEEGGPDLGPRFNLFILPGELALQDPAAQPGALDRWLASIEADYVVVELSPIVQVIPQALELWGQLHARSTPVAVFQGIEQESCWVNSIDFEDNDHMAERIRKAGAFGPCLEIYRLEPGGSAR